MRWNISHALYRPGAGFTLIELLVVVAIIGLLASVVLASLSSAREQARDAQRLADMDQIRAALQLYYGDYGHYPCTRASDCVGQSVSIGSRGSRIGEGEPIDQMLASYMSGEVPHDPLGPENEFYYYWYDPDHIPECGEPSSGVVIGFNRAEGDFESMRDTDCGTHGNLHEADYNKVLDSTAAKAAVF